MTIAQRVIISNIVLMCAIVLQMPIAKSEPVWIFATVDACVWIATFFLASLAPK